MASSSKDDTPDIEQMKRNANAWTLEGDATLLGYMKNISNNLESRCSTTTRNMHLMELNLDRSSVDLGNTINKMMFLQNNKFVENRVQEDDETMTNPKKKLSAETPKAVVPIEGIKIAARNSMNMMNKCYEQVSLDLDSGDDESDEEDAKNNNMVLRPKNPYATQQMPFLIGSREWKEKWHVGLIESDVESDEEVDEGQYSESSQEESIRSLSSASLPSNAQTLSESEGSIWGLQQQQQQKQRTKPFNPAHSHVSTSDDDLTSNKSGVKSANTDFMNNRGVPVLPTGNLKHIGVPFPNEPPPNQFAAAPLFKPTAGGGLFDDEEDDNVVVDPNANKRPAPKAVAPPTTTSIFPQQRHHEQRKIVNLFDDLPPDDDETDWAKPIASTRKKSSNDLFTEIEDTDVKQTAPSKQKSEKKNRGMFDDDFDFVPRPVDKVKTRITNLFDDEPEDDYFDEILKKNEALEKPHPKKIVEPVKSTEQKKITVPKKSSSVVKIEDSKPQPAKTTKKFSNLFDDSPPSDDEFDHLFKQSAQREKSKSTSNSFFDGETEPFAEKPIGTMSVNTQDLDKISVYSNEKDQPKVEPKKVEIVVEPVKKTVNMKSEVKESFLEDLPPEDDDFEVTSKAKLSPFMQQLFNKQVDEEISIQKEEPPKPAPRDYKSLPLFNDMPPDDDIFGGNGSGGGVAASRESDDDFFDDKAYPIPENLVKSPSNYLIQEEPPTDDYETMPCPSIPKEVVAKTELKNVLKKVQQFTDSATVTAAEEQPKRPVPKKLNPLEFKINMAALLPGAKLPKQPMAEMKDEEPTVDANVENDIEYTLRKNEEKPVAVPQKMNENPKPSSPEILSGLGRTRAKIPMKRQPSTRKGRQASYIKSLTENEEDESAPADDNTDTEEVVKSEMEKVLPVSKQPTESIASMLAKEVTMKLPNFFEDDENVEDDIFAQISKQVVTSVSAPKNKEQKSIKQPVEGKEPEMIKDQKQSLAVTPIIKELEKPKEEQQSKAPVVVTPAPETVTKIPEATKEQKPTTLFDDDIFAKQPLVAAPTSLNRPKEQKPTALSEPVTEKAIPKAANLPVEGLAPSSKRIQRRQEKQPIIKTAQTSSTAAVIAAKSNKPSTLTSIEKKVTPFVKPGFDSLFDEPPPLNFTVTTPKPVTTDDLFGDDDDLFGPPVVRQHSKAIDTSKGAVPKTKGKSLFDRPDDDDDFFSIPTTKKVVPKQQQLVAPEKQRPVKAPVSLFDDDDDDSDDLFGGGPKKSVDKPKKPKSVEKSKTLTKLKPSAQKLFNDSDDDDDDLFGSSSSKKVTSAANSRITAKPERKTSIKSSEPVFNDPLADLLK